MQTINSIKRLRLIGTISLSLSFLSLILLLNSGILPSRILGISVSSMADIAQYVIFAGIAISAYFFYKYDYLLHKLDLKSEDINNNQDDFEALPSKLKRDKAKKARDKKRAKK
jgi:hypothetical protein